MCGLALAVVDAVGLVVEEAVLVLLVDEVEVLVTAADKTEYTDSRQPAPQIWEELPEQTTLHCESSCLAEATSALPQ